MNNEGYRRLYDSTDSQINWRLPTTEALELGTILSGEVLKTDRFAKPFAVGQYLRCAAAGELEEGQRVLVAWTNGGTDPVIIDVVVTE